MEEDKIEICPICLDASDSCDCFEEDNDNFDDFDDSRFTDPEEGERYIKDFNFFYFKNK